MILLILASLLWAFSFGLQKKLTSLDPTAVAVLRLVISSLVFSPLLRAARLGMRRVLVLALIGAVQFGGVYVFYLRAYVHLHAYEVAMFTITTPIFVALIDAAYERRWRMIYMLAALLSVAGAGVLLWTSIGDSGIMTGFLLMQLSNVCFAAGQIAWRRERKRLPPGSSDASVFAVTYAGGLALALGVSAFTTDWHRFSPTGSQWLIIAYLGAIPSSFGFFLWNVGATRVNAGVLAAFNNAKVPLGVATSLIFFGETAQLGRLLLGGGVMALGVWVASGKRERGVS
jgi:drug/metabolite transporter (DMT)-like permease